MEEDKDKKKSHAAGYAIWLLVALIIILALLAAVFVTSDIMESGHEHTWNDGVETTAATCEEPGVMTYTCTDCGDTWEETILPLGHDWENEYTEATCVDMGFVTQTCSRCGATQDIDGGAATGIHTKGEDVEVTTEPTCVSAGEMAYTCEVCGEKITEEIPATGEHTVSEWFWVEDKVADCGNDGEQTGYCSVCEQTVTRTVAATGVHTWNNGSVTQPYACQDGEITYTCTVCGMEKTDVYAATSEHTWDAGTVTTEPTCVDEGVMSYTCTVCGIATKEEDIAPLGHQLVGTYVGVSPTRSYEGDIATYVGESGWTYYCSVCSDIGETIVLEDDTPVMSTTLIVVDETSLNSAVAWNDVPDITPVIVLNGADNTISLTNTLTVSSEVVIDLNGNTLTCSSDNTITVTSDGDLTIYDGSEGGNGSVSTTGSYYPIYNEGNVSIEGDVIDGGYYDSTLGGKVTVVSSEAQLRAAVAGDDSYILFSDDIALVGDGVDENSADGALVFTHSVTLDLNGYTLSVGDYNTTTFSDWKYVFYFDLSKVCCNTVESKISINITSSAVDEDGEAVDGYIKKGSSSLELMYLKGYDTEECVSVTASVTFRNLTVAYFSNILNGFMFGDHGYGVGLALIDVTVSGSV